eukprot:7218444-Prymnesium_polylepis.1
MAPRGATFWFESLARPRERPRTAQRRAQRVVTASCHFWVAPHTPGVEERLCDIRVGDFGPGKPVFHAGNPRHARFAILCTPGPVLVQERCEGKGCEERRVMR